MGGTFSSDIGIVMLCKCSDLDEGVDAKISDGITSEEICRSAYLQQRILYLKGCESRRANELRHRFDSVPFTQHPVWNGRTRRKESADQRGYADSVTKPWSRACQIRNDEYEVNLCQASDTQLLRCNVS